MLNNTKEEENIFSRVLNAFIKTAVDVLENCGKLQWKHTWPSIVLGVISMGSSI